MVEIVFILLVVEVISILFLVEVQLKIRRLLGLISKEKYSQSLAGKNGHSKLKKVITGLYAVSAVALILGTGFGIHWQSDQSLKVWQQGEVTQIANQLNQLSRGFVEEKNIRDLCIGIFKNKQTYSTCLSQGPEEDSFALDDSAIFEIGSITKTFTYMAMLQVLSKHDIELTSSIAKYLPADLAKKNPVLADITWLQLATHTSGLSRMPMSWNWETVSSIAQGFVLGNPYGNMTEDYVKEYLSSTDLDVNGKHIANYSNLAVGLLGLMLSELEEKSYAQLLQDEIILPLEMQSTTADQIVTDDSNRLDGYGQYRRLGPVVISAKSDHWTFSDALAGAGATNSSLSDMMSYLNNRMQEYRKPIFKDENHTASFDGEAITNLGWIVIPLSPQSTQKAILHDGATGGFRSYMGFVESSDVGVVILSNGTRSVNSLGKDVLRLLADDGIGNTASKNLAIVADTGS